jgi:DNA polymerase III epsilon subunit-like protein
MLAFDIETTGLSPTNSVVTVVCTECFFTGERIAYEFARVRKQEPQNMQQLVREMTDAFNRASSLCAFNGVRFDIPFLHKAFGLPDAVVAGWLVKTTDILEACRLQIFGARHTFKLDLLCEHNGVPMKSSTGLQAIAMAHEQRWEDLRVYCADDVRILCNLYRKKRLTNPRNHVDIDVTRIAHDNLFAGLPVDQRQHKAAHAAHAETQQSSQALLQERDARIKELEEQLAIFQGFCTCLDDA